MVYSVHITGYKFIIEISQAQLTFNPVWRDKRRPRDNGKYRLDPAEPRTDHPEKVEFPGIAGWSLTGAAEMSS